ncbi:hypothetical protein HYY74_04655 [Candidatus Woesearchaeota archaeon]|nr:hypothetical protein [Candidatus Woesearchaeota archaeon]
MKSKNRRKPDYVVEEELERIEGLDGMLATDDINDPWLDRQFWDYEDEDWQDS